MSEESKVCGREYKLLSMLDLIVMCGLGGGVGC